MAKISPALEKARNAIVQEVINDIENGTPLFWNNPVLKAQEDQNGLTGKPYRGINRLHLMFAQLRQIKRTGEQYKDYRWMTFKQIKDKKYHLKQGAKGTLIEYYDKQKIDIKEYLKYLETHNVSDEFIEKVKNLMSDGFETISVPFTKGYIVFNGDDIEGLPPMQEINKTLEERNQDMENMIANSEAKFEFVAAAKGFTNHFSPSQDKIVLARKEDFKDTAGFYAVAAHEIAHSTGIEDRLNCPGVAQRSINAFDEELYAKEELRAELTSMFISQKYGFEVDQEHIDNHKAYLQSWAKALKNDPNELWRAASLAEKTVEYVETHMIHPCQELKQFVNDIRPVLNQLADAKTTDEKFIIMNNIDAIVNSSDSIKITVNNNIIEKVQIADKEFIATNTLGHFGYNYKIIKNDQEQTKTITNTQIKNQQKPKAKLVVKHREPDGKGLCR